MFAVATYVATYYTFLNKLLKPILKAVHVIAAHSRHSRRLYCLYMIKIWHIDGTKVSYKRSL